MIPVESHIITAFESLYQDLRFGDIYIHWMNDEELLEVNRKHLNHNYYTDIITFDYTRQNKISGELFISKDRIKDNAAENNEPLERERDRVVAHGILHLIGFGDKTEAEKAVMRSKENEILDRL